jgi:hypothetical protein
MVIVPSAITATLTTSNSPCLVSVRSAITTYSIISSLSRHSSASSFMQVFKEVKWDKLKRDDWWGWLRRRRCCIAKCKRDDVKNQYLWGHLSCRTFIYPIGPNMFTDKYFCSTCFKEHKSEVSNRMMGAMFSNQ